MTWITNQSVKVRRIIAVFFVLVIIISSGFNLLMPRAAQAFAVADILGYPIAAGKWIWERIETAAEFAWEHGAAVAYRNAVRTFTQRLAYDSAVYLGSGGQGQQPLFVTKGWNEYLRDVHDDAVGNFLDTLAKENGYFELGLCEPLGPGGSKAKLIITLPLFREIKPVPPKCSLADIQRNWKAALADPKKFLTKFGVAFDPRQHDLGIALKLRQDIITHKETQEDISKAERLANEGIKSITEPITGAIKTPAAFLKSQFDIGLKSASDEPLQITGNAIADALGVFTNTLASQLQKRLFQQGLVPNPSGRGPSSIFGPSFGGGGIEYAVQVNTSISTPQFVISNVAIDMISELVNCPSNTLYASVNNCTIDRKFEQLLRKADEGQALTVSEAIKQSLINGGWSFKRTRPTSLRVPDAWYLSDLKKLRKARVIPVGWELAAEKFANQGVTLQQVMASFNNCADNPDMCKLIDPNWVLRAPPSQCRLQGPGQLLEPEGGNRQETCVDIEQCIAEDEDGTCQGYGYCLAEKNIWRFSGDSCEFPQGSGYSPYATCQTFSSPTGQLSVLTNSLANYDDGVCSGAAGCKWYSTVFNAGGGGGNPERFSAQDSDRYYLKNLDKFSCTASEQGCTSFLRLSNVDTDAVSQWCSDTRAACKNNADCAAPATCVAIPGNNPAEQLVNKVVADPASSYSQFASTTSAHLKEAPAYLNCYDLDATSIPITSNDAVQCKNYLTWCSEAEAGCESYTASDGSPAVPAILQPTDYCPQECVGLDRFYQEPTFFEPLTPLLLPALPPNIQDFIPATARTCPAQAVGCEEFTNLDQSPQGEQREYYSKLQQCISASDPQAATYFTWVGSDLTGYQLKTWRLQSSNPGNPAAPPFTPSGSCENDFGTTNPDCKQFYSLSGAISYHWAADVITASAQCSRYRATNVKQTDCGPTNGTWDAGLNACLYNAVPGEGIKCEARYNGCRAYKGPNANNIQLVFPVSTFGDQAATSGLTIDASPASGWGSGRNSNESLSAFGHSFASGPLAAGSTFIARYLPGGIKTGQRYLFSFWAKAFPDNGEGEIIINQPAGSYDWQVDLPTLTNNWQIYQLESEIPFNSDLSKGVYLTLNSTQEFVIDNIVVKNISDTFYAIKDSWSTPAVCEVEPPPSRYLGCRSYINRTNQTITATGFSQLCRAEAIGCEPLINTQNSDKPQQQEITAAGQTITTPTDQIVYRVYDSNKACPAQAEACRLVGEPNLDAKGQVASWGDRFVKLDPDKFDPANPSSPLCTKAQDRCQVFSESGGVTHYFKDPGKSLCEYKQLDPLSGYDWYVRGTSEPCNLLSNPSFEKNTDHGRNLLDNGDFEQDTAGDPPTSWTSSPPPADLWQVQKYDPPQNNEQAYQGKQYLFAPSVGSPYLRQTVKVKANQAYTARVWSRSPVTTSRTLRVFGCGVDLSDTSQLAGNWQMLQITFISTTTSCTIELRSSPGPANTNGNTYYDEVSVYLADDFPGWRRNGESVLLNDPLTNLSVMPSLAGQYWGSQALAVETTARLYSGVWSNMVELASVDLVNPRFFTVSANVYVPDLPQNNSMLTWQLSQHAVPELLASCPPRTLVNDINPTCHHYDYEPGSDFNVTAAEKGRWVYKQATIKVDPGVRFLSVGLITNFGAGIPLGCSYDPIEIATGTLECASQVCTADTCQPNQVIYVDQVSIVEGKIQPAYQCPSDQSSCTAFQDPELTKQTYYYLNNKKIDRSSCAGQVSEKEGCLLFADLSNPTLSWNAATTYDNSHEKNNALVAPLQNATKAADTNTILRVSRSRVCGEWLSCLDEALQYDQTGRSTSICYALGRCDNFGSEGSAKCGNWKIETDPQPLTAAFYQQRGTDWSDQDLSGYSIPGIYSLDTLKQKNYGDQNNPDIHLTYLNPLELRVNGTGDSCDIIYEKKAGGICLPADQGINGQGPGVATSYSNTLAKQCRLYPETDSPFPSDLAIFKQGDETVEGAGNIEQKNIGYKDANICQPTDSVGEPQDCECSYQRTSYKQSEIRFYSLFSQPHLSILTDEDTDARSHLQQQDYFLGLRGYCLEKDTSRAINGNQDNACLTWLPLDVVLGDLSIYDYTPKAGYAGGETYYCSQAAGNNKNDSYSTGLGSKGPCDDRTYDSEYKHSDWCNLIWGNLNYDLSTASFIAFHNNSPKFPEQFHNWPGGGLVFDTHANYNNCSDGYTKSNWCKVTGSDGFDFTEYPDKISNFDYVYIWRNCNSLDCNTDGYNKIDFRIYIENKEFTNNKFKYYKDVLKGIRIAGKDDTGEPYDDELHKTNPTIKYLEACKEAVQVGTSMLNKAFTNKINTSTYEVEKLGYTNATLRQPFGRLFSEPKEKNWVLVGLKNAFINIPNRARQYIWGGFPEISGELITSPYSCPSQDSYYCGPAGSGLGGNCINTDPLGSSYSREVYIDGDNPDYKIIKCDNNSQCGTNGICIGYFNNSLKLEQEGTQEGRDRVSKMFAKEYGLYNWEQSGWVKDVDNIIDISDGGVAPEVKQVAFDNDNKPSEGGNGFSIITANGPASGDIEVASPANVSALFYAYNPNGEQMPLAEVRVDWVGDPTNSSGAAGKYKNHKHECKKSSDPGYNFGDWPQACVDDAGVGVGYFTFTRSLTCNTGGAGLRECSDPNRLPYEACWDEAAAGATGACVYSPRVYVRDNWDWCYGGAKSGSEGPHWGIFPEPAAECDLTNEDAWLQYNGKILVKP
ncbi:MAG: hypothetical protein ABIJ81_02685 [Patescibacteria group bacterium]